MQASNLRTAWRSSCHWRKAASRTVTVNSWHISHSLILHPTRHVFPDAIFVLHGLCRRMGQVPVSWQQMNHFAAARPTLVLDDIARVYIRLHGSSSVECFAIAVSGSAVSGSAASGSAAASFGSAPGSVYASAFGSGNDFGSGFCTFHNKMLALQSAKQSPNFIL